MRRLSALALVLAFAAAAAAPAAAQYFRFGKNKVQYGGLEWRYVQTEHFDVFYYTTDTAAGAEPSAETDAAAYAFAAFTAEAAEDAYRQIADLIDYEVTHRIPILAYRSHNPFAVTNAVDLPDYSEGIGGVTELFKNRVALPFTGSYREYRRVLHHELVHAVLNDLYYGGSLQNVIRSGVQLQVPLWFNEGLAEYAALGWDTNSDAYLRDAVVHDYLAPIPRLSGYFAYRGGQGVFDYIAEQYGREKVAEIVQRVKVQRSVEGAFRRAIGLSVEELSERWHEALRSVYFPEVAAREDVGTVARALVTDENGGFYNTSPALAPQGDKLAFLTSKGAFFDVYVVSTTDGRPPRRLIRGQNSAAFESLRILTPGLSWGPDGRHLAVAVKSGPGDAIAVVDTETGASVRYRVPGVEAVLSVAVAPDGYRIAFEGTANGQSDLFVLDTRSGAVTNLTADVFSDHEPSWSADGRQLAFHSDRGPYTATARHRAPDFAMAEHAFGQYDVYTLQLDAPERLTRVTADAADDTSPAFGPAPPDGAGEAPIVFISDRNGVPNLWAREGSGAERPLTDLLAAVSQLSLSRDGRRAALAALDDGVPSLFLLRDPLGRTPPAPLAPTVWAQRIGEGSPAPALALAPPDRAEGNPLLRDALNPAPYPLAWGPRRGVLPPPAPAVRTFDVDSLLATLAPPDTLQLASLDTTGAGDFAVDYRTYRFSDAFEEARDAARAAEAPAFDPAAARTADGALVSRPYRLRFSPDLVYGNVGYDTYFGVQSLTQMLFSDVLGNHRIVAATNLLIDLRNSDYLLGYAYLARRTDYEVQAYHLARQVTDFSRQTIYRYRNYGLVVGAEYPLGKFRRVEAEVSFQGITLTDLAATGARSRTQGFVLPAVTYTHDQTVPGFLTPQGGFRWAARLSASPGPYVGFATALADARAYVGLGYTYSLALRASAAASAGPDAQRFYAAGVENWVNFYLQDQLLAFDVAELGLLTPVLPLRGHGFYAASGTRFGLVNAEFRFPLVAALLPGPIPLLPLYHLQGVAFADVAAIGDDDFDAWSVGPDGKERLDDVLVGAGLGLRTILLGYPLRLDWGWPYDGRGFGKARLYFSLGLDF